MTLRAVTPALGLVLLLAATGDPTAPPSTKALLDALGKATLSRSLASISSIHTSGAVEVLGLRGRAQEWDDLRSVRFATAQNASALSGAAGWDGKAAWNQDYSGLVTIDGGAAGRLQSIDQAYLVNLRYLRADAGGATVVYAGRRTQSGKTYDVLALTPPHGSEVDLWIDPYSHLIAQETGTIGIVSFATVLSDYRRVDGLVYPFETTTRTSEGNSSSERVTSLELNADVAERVRMPASSVHDFTIAGAAGATVPLEIVNNHVYLDDVMLDGRGPYTFVLDSGGDYIVTPQVAAALGARSSGGVQLQGVGAATEGAAFTHIGSIAIGKAVVRNQYSLVLPIATGFGLAEGMRIDGMIGYQFLARFLTTIDYAGSKLTLAIPGTAPAAAPGAATIKFFLDGTIPIVPVTVQGVATTAEVDTGNRAGLLLTPTFLGANPAIEALAKTPPGVTGFGVGGPSYARLGRVATLQIGPYIISNTIASFAVGTKGALADPFTDANIGGAIWRNFDLTFDYPHQQLLLAKGPGFDAPVPQDRSGLFLIDANGAYVIISVLAQTPGATAGLVKGETIAAINGASASSLSLAGLRQLLCGPAGSIVHLRVRDSAGNERDVVLTLADYV